MLVLQQLQQSTSLQMGYSCTNPKALQLPLQCFMHIYIVYVKVDNTKFNQIFNFKLCISIFMYPLENQAMKSLSNNLSNCGNRFCFYVSLSKIFTSFSRTKEKTPAWRILLFSFMHNPPLKTLICI